MGRDGIDNGYIQFTYVRIPRSYMLQKHTQVTRQGDVYEPALAQLTYGALLQGRTAMVEDAGNISKKALTIALRYGVVRRQFKTGDNAVSPVSADDLRRHRPDIKVLHSLRRRFSITHFTSGA